jgi:hypothetical protein
MSAGSFARQATAAVALAAGAVASPAFAQTATPAQNSTATAKSGTPSQTSLDARREAARICKEANVRPTLLADCTANTAQDILNAQAEQSRTNIAAMKKAIECADRLKSVPQPILARIAKDLGITAVNEETACALEEATRGK